MKKNAGPRGCFSYLANPLLILFGLYAVWAFYFAFVDPAGFSKSLPAEQQLGELPQKEVTLEVVPSLYASTGLVVAVPEARCNQLASLKGTVSLYLPDGSIQTRRLDKQTGPVQPLLTDLRMVGVNLDMQFDLKRQEHYILKILMDEPPPPGASLWLSGSRMYALLRGKDL